MEASFFVFWVCVRAAVEGLHAFLSLLSLLLGPAYLPAYQLGPSASEKGCGAGDKGCPIRSFCCWRATGEGPVLPLPT